MDPFCLFLLDELLHLMQDVLPIGFVEFEDDILSSRKYYNAVARAFNDKIMVFPASIIASAFHFVKRDYVDVADEARERVEVRF